jgi:hypothetical protein
LFILPAAAQLYPQKICNVSTRSANNNNYSKEENSWLSKHGAMNNSALINNFLSNEDA